MRRGVFVLFLIAVTFTAAVAQAAPRGRARFVISRTDEYFAHFVTTQILVNGAHVADVTHGQTVSGSLPTGPVEIAVTAPLEPGKTKAKFTAIAGRTYRFIVSSRAEPYVAGALFGVVGVLIEGGGPFKIAPTR